MHRHTWRTVGYLPLSLPTHDGFSERLMQWVCGECRQYADITGEVRVGTPIFTPEFWTRLQTVEQNHGLPLARQARQQQDNRHG